MRGISVAKLTIYKYVRTGKGWRYCKAAFDPNVADKLTTRAHAMR